MTLGGEDAYYDGGWVDDHNPHDGYCDCDHCHETALQQSENT